MVCSGREVVVAGTAASKRPFTFSQPTGPAPTSTGTKSGFDEKNFVIFSFSAFDSLSDFNERRVR